MQTALIIFASNNKPFSLLIKLGTLSNWCHCAILDGEYVIDTTLLTGCRRTHISEWEKHYPTYSIVHMPIVDKEASIELARSWVGSKYDWLGIFSFLIRKNYQDEKKYFCSEQVAIYLGVKNIPWRLSPAFLYRMYRTMKGYIL